MTRHELKAIRERLGLSQAGFAHRLGIKSDTVCRYETGKTSIPPSVTTLAKILIAMKTKGLTEHEKLNRIAIIISLDKDLEEDDPPPGASNA